MLIPGLDLTELKSRVAVALRSNSSIANVDGYTEIIQDAVTKFQTVEPGSGIKYLYQLICVAEAIDPSTAVVITPELVVEETKEPESPPIVEETKEPEQAPELEATAEETVSDDEWAETTEEEPHEEKPETHESKPAKPAKPKKSKKS